MLDEIGLMLRKTRPAYGEAPVVKTPWLLKRECNRALDKSYVTFEPAWKKRMEKLPPTKPFDHYDPYNLLGHYHASLIYSDLHGLIKAATDKGVTSKKELPVAMAQALQEYIIADENNMKSQGIDNERSRKASALRFVELRCALDEWATALGIKNQMLVAMRKVQDPAKSIAR